MLFEKAVRIILLILICNYVDVNPIKCYQCRSDMHQNCEQKAADDYLLECPAKEEPDVSRLAIQGLSYEDENKLSDTDDDALPPDVTPIHCRKITQSLKVRKSSETIIIRECTFSYIGEDCNTVNTKLVTLEVCDCKKEACNAGHGLHIAHTALWTILLINIAIKLFYY